MKLQDHPFVHWPEIWIFVHPDKHLIWETEQSGNLVAVTRSSNNNTLVLATEHNGERYIGALLCKDATFAEQLYSILKRHIGEPIRDVAELEILREL